MFRIAMCLNLILSSNRNDQNRRRKVQSTAFIRAINYLVFKIGRQEHNFELREHLSFKKLKNDSAFGK